LGGLKAALGANNFDKQKQKSTVTLAALDINVSTAFKFYVTGTEEIKRIR
jgi:hypothetical protein